MILKNNDMRLMVIGKFKLLPGCNEIDKKLWVEYQTPIKNDKGMEYTLYDFTELLKSKAIEIIKYKKGDKEAEFKDFPSNKKEEIVNDTYNVETLEGWRKVEPDVSIKVLIEDRLKGINNKTIKDVKNYGTPKNHV